MAKEIPEENYPIYQLAYSLSKVCKLYTALILLENCEFHVRIEKFPTDLDCGHVGHLNSKAVWFEINLCVSGHSFLYGN